MRIGVDYYPEHWDRSLWKQDADLMQKTGVEVVRMGEFAWCKMEPSDGKFEFEWLDEAIALFAERGISVILGTPTSCPPLWFYEKYPDAIQTGKDGRKIATGIRGHRCYNNPDHIRYAKRIVDAMTKRYAENKAVIGWQVDNELEANFCFCPICIGKFREWLKEKYGTLQKVNKAYGNDVWSGEYSSWEQVQPPFGSYPQAWLNPSMMLDFNRYASDSVIEYMNMQAEIIRKNCPEHTITTNTWFCENMPDFYKEFETLDFVSYDNYPPTRIPNDPENCYSHAFHLDLMRGIKEKKFWIMEQLSGGLGCWMPMTHTPLPGMIKGYSLQAFAHGADTVVHFRWRTAVSGAEMHWHGLIDHSNVPGRRFHEFEELCKTAQKWKKYANTELVSEVAILYSPENEWAFKIQPQTDGWYYLEQLMMLHRAFSKYGINVDIVSEMTDLSKYKIVVAPEMYVTNENTVKALYHYAQQGGTVVLTNRSGVKTENNTCVMAQLPGAYRELVGAYAEEYDPCGYDEFAVTMDGVQYTCKRWCDILCAETADTVANYGSGYFVGKPAVTVNRYGKGKAYYIGTVGKTAFYQALAKKILDGSDVEYYEGLPDNVEVTTRMSEQQMVRFIFNNTEKEQHFSFEGKEIAMQPFEMLVHEC